jgi:hypothetical protein
MTPGQVARATGFALAAVILAVSSIYVVIDLARWEWNRAVISALVMIAALIVLVAMMLFRQLHRIEQRMDALERSGDGNTLGALRSANANAAGRHFRWLERPPDGLGVFIPVLLGAGVLMSLVAYLIERIAGLFAAATLDPRTASKLGADLPLGNGLPPLAQLDPMTRPPVRSNTALVTVLVLTLALSTGAVILLRELTQTRPGEVASAGSTAVVLDIDQRRQSRPLPTVAEDLFGSCRSRLPGDVELTVITPVDDERVMIEFDRALGRTGRARIVGCLEDHTLDRVRADVLSIRSTPAQG